MIETAVIIGVVWGVCKVRGAKPKTKEEVTKQISKGIDTTASVAKKVVKTILTKGGDRSE